MYRDQRDALMARVAALDKELERRKKRIAEQGEDLEDTSERLEDAEDELKDLRKKLAKYEQPKEGAPKSRMVFIGIAGALVLLSGILVFAVNDETSAAPSKYSGTLEGNCDLGETYDTHFDRSLPALVKECVVPFLPAGAPAVSGYLKFAGGNLDTLTVTDAPDGAAQKLVETCLSDVVSAWDMGEQSCEGSFTFTY